MSLYLLLLQCFTCLVHLIWLVLEMGGRWLYSYCFIECCFQDVFNIAHSILVQFSSSFFSIHLVSVHVLHPYSRIDMTAAWKKYHSILSDKSDFHMYNNLLIAIHAFACHILMSFSVDETLLLSYVNFSTKFRKLPLSVEMCPFGLKPMYSVLSAFIWRLMPLAACSILCSRD